MSWNRANVASALVSVLTPVVGVKVHHLPPETLNPMCVVVGRPQVVSYATYAFGIDDAQLPLMIVGGIETEDQIEALKDQCRDTVLSNKTLGGAVQNIFPLEERNWRNVSGAGGIQLLLVELILQIQM